MFPSTDMPFLFNTSATFIIFFLSLWCYLWLPWVFIAACVLSLVVSDGSCSLVTRRMLSTAMASLLQSTGRLSSCGTGLSCPWHVGSSWTWYQTCDSCFDRSFLKHWTSREVLTVTFNTMCLELSGLCLPSD